MRTTISLSPYNSKRIKKFIVSQKHLLGPRISFSVFIEEAVNIAWTEVTKKYMDQCYNMEKRREVKTNPVMPLSIRKPPEGTFCSVCGSDDLKVITTPFSGPYSGRLECNKCKKSEAVMSYIGRNIVDVQPLPPAEGSRLALEKMYGKTKEKTKFKINDVVVFYDGAIGVISFVSSFTLSQDGIQYYNVDRSMTFSMYFPEVIMKKIGHL